MGRAPIQREKLSGAVVAVLADLKADRGLADKDLARMAGVSAPTMSRIFAGTRGIHLDELELICAGLGLKPSRVIRAAEERVIPEDLWSDYDATKGMRQPDPFDGMKRP